VAALAGIMLVVVLHTFKWFSLAILVATLPACIRNRVNLQQKIPRIEALVILLVTVMAVFTNIAYAVISGVAVCAIAFSWNSASNFEVSVKEDSGIKRYMIEGPLFFTTANKLSKLLNPENEPNAVEVHFGSSSVMDYTAIETLNKIAISYKSKGKTITFHTMNQSSRKLIEKANHLISSIEYTSGNEVHVQDVPDVTRGFRANPLTCVPSANEESRSDRVAEMA